MADFSCLLSTDAGMYALWTPEEFRGVHDYDTWEAELLEDGDAIDRRLQRHAAARVQSSDRPV